MNRWENMVDYLEEICYGHEMVRIAIRTDDIQLLEYYLYIEEIKYESEEIILRSGNFELTIEKAFSIIEVDFCKLIIKNKIIIEIEKI